MSSVFELSYYICINGRDEPVAPRPAQPDIRLRDENRSLSLHGVLEHLVKGTLDRINSRERDSPCVAAVAALLRQATGKGGLRSLASMLKLTREGPSRFARGAPVRWI